MKMKINKQFLKQTFEKIRSNYLNIYTNYLNIYTITFLIIILLFIGDYFHFISFLLVVNYLLIYFLISIILFFITIEKWLIELLFLIENMDPIIFKNITIHIKDFICFLLDVLLGLCRYVLFYTSLLKYVLLKLNPNLLLNDIIFLIAQFKTMVDTYLIATQDFID